MKYKISILCPGIRTYNWESLCKSIDSSTTYSWEIIFVGPYRLPDNLQNKKNISFIQDWGSPIRCQQIALVHSRGEYINWAADDGIFLPDALDDGFTLLKDSRDIVMQKYFEGRHDKHFEDHKYYLLSYHGATQARYIPDNFYTLNVGIIKRSILFDIGGWDCSFEVCPMAYADLAIRLQWSNHSFKIQDSVAFACSHMPGTSGDHGPIHYAQITHDEPLYKQMYNDESCRNRINIDINNWRQSSDKWQRRFPHST